LNSISGVEWIVHCITTSYWTLAKIQEGDVFRHNNRTKIAPGQDLTGISDSHWKRQTGTTNVCDS